MRSRSQIHMLRVAAARLEADHGAPEVVTALKKAAGITADKRSRRETGNDHDADETRKQTERHRTLFNLLPNGSDKERLKTAMLQYAYDLMWDGDCGSVDALTEFLPNDDVAAMFDAWQDDQFGGKPKSKWYDHG